MANKRELKKFICNTCGSLAADMVNLAELFPQIDPADVQRIGYLPEELSLIHISEPTRPY